MKKITILALHLGYGGIEKSICGLANMLVDNYNVEILSIYKLYDEPAFYLDDKVNVRYLSDVVPNKNDFKYAVKKFNIFKIIKEGIKAIRILNIKRKVMIDAIDSCDSDIIISTRIYLNRLLGEYGNDNVRRIGWEHNHHHGDKKYIAKFIKSVRDLEDVVLVSEELRKDYQARLDLVKCKCKCICIPNFLEELPDKINGLDNKDIVSVGRLSPEKGFLDLIKVFKLVERKDGDVFLSIIGDGIEHDSVFKAVVDANLSRKVRMYGYQGKDVINSVYEKSSLYVMTSKTESFGIVLLEAMSYGIPCIAFDSAEGARDLIDNNYNGYLIKNRNEHEMADKINELLNDKKLLLQMGKNARKRAEKYSKDQIIKDWIKLLGE